MIKYSLICADDHQFDSWFASADAFETLRASGMINCVVCGTPDVNKAIMAPRVQPSDTRSKAQIAAPVVQPPAVRPERPLSTPASAAEQAITELKKKIEANSDYVGKDFAREARAIHDGDAPERSIHGEANAKEAKSLMEDGIPVLPLPFAPRRKTN